MLIDKLMIMMTAEYSEVINQQHAYELHMLWNHILIFSQAVVWTLYSMSFLFNELARDLPL